MTLTRDEAVVVFKAVPADICQDCGEYYLSDDLTDRLLFKYSKARSSQTPKPFLGYTERTIE